MSAYYAQIRFYIDIIEMNPDGTLSPNKLNDSELKNLGITNTAVFCIEGYNKENCIQKLKETLMGLKYEER